jgi:agmatine deiminase
MIKDSQTNFLYLADTLPEKYPDFYSRLEVKLKECKVNYGLLPHTQDVWAVDYMPIQVNPSRFIQFKYCPDYLRDTKKWQKTIRMLIKYAILSG